MFRRLYLHIPFCRRKCAYCAFVSRAFSPGDCERYVALLHTEMQHAAVRYPGTPPLDSVYFGGGTPSLLSPGQVASLLDAARRLFGFAPDMEITLEANPGTVERGTLAGFRAAGINRLSLGLQSFDDRLLALLGRIHTSAEAVQAFEDARGAGFDTIGIDLIHALPGQTMGQWQSDLDRALKLCPEHISVYGLTIEEGTPFAERYTDHGQLPDEDLSADMFLEADSLLTRGGYVHYEIANYALPGREARHNSGYWHRDGYLGLGCGAHSFLRQGYGMRFANPADETGYARSVADDDMAARNPLQLTREDAVAEHLFLGLRLAAGVDEAQFSREFGFGLEERFGSVIHDLVRGGLLEFDHGRLRLTLRGMLLSNQVFHRFLP